MSSVNEIISIGMLPPRFRILMKGGRGQGSPPPLFGATKIFIKFTYIK